MCIIFHFQGLTTKKNPIKGSTLQNFGELVKLQDICMSNITNGFKSFTQ